MRYILFFVLISCTLFSCKKAKDSNLNIPSPKNAPYVSNKITLSDDVYYDKILGALVGSAIGDAMGASTEMWHRNNIQLKYGYITSLTPAVREQSPEGTWGHHLVAGATTDDTRWKYAMVNYISKYPGQLTANNFATFITDYYASLTKMLSDGNTIPNPDFIDTQIEKIDWIKEWARVALAYQENPEAYQKALNRFYGGEMSCAGQLYTPLLGFVSNNPNDAYTLAYDHSIFDLGYAKDISALVAAMTNMAIQTKDIDSIINTATFVDPMGYQDSRLVGRISYALADASVKHVLAVNAMILSDSSATYNAIFYKMPKGFLGTQKDWIRQEMVYQFLESNKKASPFHSGEIWQILITGLQFGEGNFEKTMQFIVNYGRDNDTVAAVAGMILGAKDGYSGLPKILREQALKVNKEVMGIDLEALAKVMVAQNH